MKNHAAVALGRLGGIVVALLACGGLDGSISATGAVLSSHAV